MQFALNYSDTRVLSTENLNYLIPWWIPSKVGVRKIVLLEKANERKRPSRADR